MILYRGVRDILYKNINHLFKNENDDLLNFGKATSYSTDTNLANDYVMFHKKFAWMISIDFHTANPLYINLSHFIDEDSMEEGFLFNSQYVKRNDLVNYANNQGYDCVIFDYDDSDTHVMLLNNANISNLNEIKLFVDEYEIRKALPLVFDSENSANVSFSIVGDIDEILSTFI